MGRKALREKSMYLIQKGRKKRAICRECAKLHAAKDCPKAISQRARNFAVDALAFQAKFMAERERRIV
jgi:hypothetical protein